MVNIGVIGGVSVGKSTFVNSLLCKNICDMGLKTKVNYTSIYSNNERDTSLIPCSNFLSIDIGFTKNKDINLIDYPGLIFNKSENLNNIIFLSQMEKLDILVYVIDKDHMLENKDEENFINLISKKISDLKKNKGKILDIIFVINKCDHDDYYKEDFNKRIYDMLNCLDEIFPEYEIFPISASKMMVKNIIRKDTYLYESLSKKLILQVLKSENMSILDVDKNFIKEIEDVKFTHHETDLIKLLEKLTNYDHWENTHVYATLKLDFDEPVTFNTIYKKMSQHSKYMHIERVSHYYDEIYFNLIDRAKNLNFSSFINFDKYLNLNKKSTLPLESMYDIFCSKIFPSQKYKKINDTNVRIDTHFTFILEHSIKKEVPNFLNFKFKNEKKMIEMDKMFKPQIFIDNRDLIIRTHENLKFISMNMDKIIISSMLRKSYNWNYILSMNENLIFALGNYINLTPNDIIPMILPKLYGTEIVSSDNQIFKYDSIIKKCTLQKDKMRFYLDKIILHVILQENYFDN